MSDAIKKLRRRVDWGLLATLALCLFALLPLTASGGVVHGHDTLLHAHRMAEMQRSWSHGLLLPTWAETLYYGYGSPVFHYYSPLAYYAGAALLTLGVDVVTAIHVLVAASLMAAGVGMYWFAREHFGKLGGVLAALCYVYSPYLLYTEPYTRGDYPELLAFALFPFVMWRFERLVRRGSALDVVLAALSLVPLVLAHNLMAVALFGLMIGWLVWRALTRELPLTRLALALGVAALGIGLMAYFWLPVGLERGAVQIDNVELITQGRRHDFFDFFIPAARLLSFNMLTDEGAANGIQMHLNLGVAQWVLAVSGVVGAVALSLRKARNLRILTVISFFAIAALLMIVLMLPLAYPIWTNFPLLNYMVFPWRFLGPVAFCLSLLAGANVLWLRQLPARPGGLLYAGCLLAPLALSLPLLHMPARYTAPLDTSVSAYLQGEIDGSISLGTTAYNEFLPTTVYVLPPANQRLVNELMQGYPIDPAQRDSLPAGVSLDLLDHHPERSVWQVNAPEAFTLEALIFDFPGWQAQVDGQIVPITPSDQYGLITFPVPAGEHTVTLSLGSTPVRNLAVAVSVGALLAATAFVVYRYRKPLAQPSGETISVDFGWRWVGAVAIVQAVLTVLLLREGTAWLHSPVGEAQPAQYQQQYQLGDQMRLLGYDLSSAEVSPGDQLQVILYWYAARPPAYNYSSFVHISNGGPPLAQLDKALVTDRPSAAWVSDGYLRDVYLISLPETMPPGEYQILVGVYTCETLPAGECGNGDRLQVIGPDGAVLGDSVLLGTLVVR
ncbi:MAG: 6-pyruvoyl-tetrahydropterin synthase-related protein [Anaerolineae bacterium]